MVKLYYIGDKDFDSRDDLRKLNIIDMNIVPINVHALQREIPFINLFNYGYSFERMIFDTLIPQQGAYRVNNIPNMNTVTAAPVNPGWFTRTSMEYMAKACIHPYNKVSPQEFYGWMYRIVSGDSGLDMGRPKYLGDQLWNKVLLQELYTKSHEDSHSGTWVPDEAGPTSDSTRARVAPRSFRAADQHLALSDYTHEAGRTTRILDQLLLALQAAVGI